MKKSFKKIIGLLAVALVLIVLVSVITGQSLGESVQTVSEMVGLTESESQSGGTYTVSAPQGDTSKQAEEAEAEPAAEPDEEPAAAIDEVGIYTSRDDVALYIYTYGHLPSNFITKKEAEAAGWPGGGLDQYCPDKCIGGDSFGNREGLLPKASGRRYTECDINTLHASSRGAERIVFSNDGLIYYTKDHYESFELLYGEP